MTNATTLLDNPVIRHSVKRISVDEYHRLSESAIISESTELLYGIIIEQMTKSPLHTWIVRLLADRLRESLPNGFDVRQEQPITLDDSEPEPDLAVVRGGPADYRKSHPSTAEIIMEVAITTVDLDRAKSFAYSLAGVKEFWLVLPKHRRVDVHHEPTEAGYLHKREISAPASVEFGPFPGITVDLDQLFDGVSHE